MRLFHEDFQTTDDECFTMSLSLSLQPLLIPPIKAFHRALEKIFSTFTPRNPPQIIPSLSSNGGFRSLLHPIHRVKLMKELDKSTASLEAFKVRSFPLLYSHPLVSLEYQTVCQIHTLRLKGQQRRGRYHLYDAKLDTTWCDQRRRHRSTHVPLTLCWRHRTYA